MAITSTLISAIRDGVEEIGLAAKRGAIAARPAIRPGASILDLLKSDHDRFRQQLAAIRKAKGKTRAALFKALKRDVTAHSRAEEKAFYRPLSASERGKEKGLEGTVEHQLIDDLLARLARPRDKDTDLWSAGAQVLQELLGHHLDEEERDDFPMAEKRFDAAALDRMGALFLKEKRRRGFGEDAPGQAAE